ncbi:MAG: YetF domain-containing protein [Bacteroidota bacterium]
MNTSNFPFDIIIRTAAVYFFLIISLLIFGKKELSQLSITDLVFILLISNSVQNAMVGTNSSLEGGLLAAGVLFALNLILRRLNYKFKFIRKITEGNPIILIYDGELQEKTLEKQQITHEEIMAAVREHGLKNISDVNLAMLEIDGNISVISYSDEKKTHFVRKHRQRLSKKIE